MTRLSHRTGPLRGVVCAGFVAALVVGCGGSQSADSSVPYAVRTPDGQWTYPTFSTAGTAFTSRALPEDVTLMPSPDGRIYAKAGNQLAASTYYRSIARRTRRRASSPASPTRADAVARAL